MPKFNFCHLSFSFFSHTSHPILPTPSTFHVLQQFLPRPQTCPFRHLIKRHHHLCSWSSPKRRLSLDPWSLFLHSCLSCPALQHLCQPSSHRWLPFLALASSTLHLNRCSSVLSGLSAFALPSCRSHADPFKFKMISCQSLHLNTPVLVHRTEDKHGSRKPDCTALHEWNPNLFTLISHGSQLLAALVSPSPP